MNDNDILLATQNGCNLILTTEEGGDYPAGSKVFSAAGVTADITNLTRGDNLFKKSTINIDWDADLPNLITAGMMFYQCTGLASFTGNLPKLAKGDRMFTGCTGLTSWTVDLPELANAGAMFAGCTGLTSFTGDLSKLAGGKSTTDGGFQMFNGCSNLTSFNAGPEGLKNLSYASGMFVDCNLDEASVLHILNTIPAYTSDTHPLHLGKSTNYKNSTAIAALLGTTTPIAASESYSYKGWTVTVAD